MQLMLPEKSLPVLAEEMIRLWAIVKDAEFLPCPGWPQFKDCAEEWSQRTGNKATFKEFENIRKFLAAIPESLKMFRIGVREVHYSYVEIEAVNKEAAIEKVQNYEGDETSLVYSHTDDLDTWTIEEIPHDLDN